MTDPRTGLADAANGSTVSRLVAGLAGLAGVAV